MADRYHDTNASGRALDLAWTSQQVELRELGVTPSDAAVFMELAGREQIYAAPGQTQRRLAGGAGSDQARGTGEPGLDQPVGQRSEGRELEVRVDFLMRPWTAEDLTNAGKARQAAAGGAGEPAFCCHGGRVLNVVGLGRDVQAAVARAYEVAAGIDLPGVVMRRDIGKGVA